MAISALVLFAVSGATLTTESVVRSGCGDEETQVAKLPAGVQVEVRSAMSGGSGTCYKITATVDGKQVAGYVPANALSSIGSFDQARRSARDVGFAGAANDVKTLARSATAKVKRDHPASKAWDLIDQNQPAEALRVMEKDLQRYPMDPYLHAAAGMAYYRMDNLEKAMLHWRNAIDIEPNPSIQRLIDQAGREKAADKGSERMVGTRVALRYERGTVSEPLARAMLSTLDEEYSRISFQLGCRASEKVTAVVQSRDAYMQSTNAAEWTGGLFDGRIHVPVSDSQQVPPRTRQTFAHELVHACLHELGNWPSWLHEGLAQKYSGRSLDPVTRAELNAMLKANQLPKLSQLGQNWMRMSADRARVAYAYALLAAERLLALNANTGIGNVLRNPDDFVRVAEELQKSLGL